MNRFSHPSRQRGQFILFLILLIFTAVGFSFYYFVTPSSARLAADTVTASALGQARDALIGRAAAAADRPGSLPCPDTDNDGLENWDVSGSNCASYIGRLPWMTLGLPDLRDGSGERLWYALSPNFRDHVLVQPLNSDSGGQLTVTGNTPDTSVIAILFAPGEALGTQVRGTANLNDVTQYLEGENNNGDLTYTTALVSSTFNDRSLTLTSSALFSVVVARVAMEARTALNNYQATNGYYPYANDYADGSPFPCKDTLRDGRIPLAISSGCAQADWIGQLPGWFSANNWNQVTHYGMDNACGLTVTGYTTAGCAVVIVTGRALGTQIRPCASAANCLEDTENTNGDSTYIKPSSSTGSNDRMAVSCSAVSPCAATP